MDGLELCRLSCQIREDYTKKIQSFGYSDVHVITKNGRNPLFTFSSSIIDLLDICGIEMFFWENTYNGYYLHIQCNPNGLRSESVISDCDDIIAFIENHDNLKDFAHLLSSISFSYRTHLGNKGFSNVSTVSDNNKNGFTINCSKNENEYNVILGFVDTNENQENVTEIPKDSYESLDTVKKKFSDGIKG